MGTMECRYNLRKAGLDEAGRQAWLAQMDGVARRCMAAELRRLGCAPLGGVRRSQVDAGVEGHETWVWEIDFTAPGFDEEAISRRCRMSIPQADGALDMADLLAGSMTLE